MKNFLRTFFLFVLLLALLGILVWVCAGDRLGTLFPRLEELFPRLEELFPRLEELLPPAEELLPPAEELLPTAEELLPTAEELLPAALARDDTPGGDRALYDLLLEELQARSPRIVLARREAEEITPVFQQICLEHPELFWLTGGCSYQITTLGGRIPVQVELVPQIYEEDRVPEKERRLRAAVEEALRPLSPEASDYEKALYVHDYLVDTVEYDRETFARYTEGAGSRVFSDAYTAYGCLVEHRAVCDGYARAFQLLMQELGIPCGRVTGRRIGGEDHTWNYVTLDGADTYVDVTWDDPVSDQGDIPPLSHAYFGLTSAELWETHSPDPGQILPDCVTEDFDYYRRTGAYIPEGDPAQAAQVAAARGADQWVELKFPSEAARASFVAGYLESQAIYDLPGLGGCAGLQYILGPSDRVLGLRMLSGGP